MDWPLQNTGTFAPPDCVVCCENALQTRYHGGLAILVGHTQLRSPSNPRKKFKTKTVSGSMTRCSCVSGVVTNSENRWDFSGTAVYNPVDGSCSSSMVQAVYQRLSGAATGCGNGLTFQRNDALPCGYNFDVPSQAGDSNLASSWVGQAGPNYTATTATSEVTEYTGAATCASGSYYDGVIRLELTNEFTEDDAIARLLGGKAWSDYQNAIRIASRKVRDSTAFSFPYWEVEFKIETNGLLPLTDYTWSVSVMRRAYGSGSFTLYATATDTVATDALGNFLVKDQSVPNDPGYETYVTGLTIVEA